MPAPAVKLSLGWKRWKAWDEQDPSKKVTKPGRRKKTKVLKGAAKNFAARKHNDDATRLPTPRTGTRANPAPISPQSLSPPQHQQPTSSMRHPTSSMGKRKSSRVTRSTAPRKSRRASKEINRYDPNPITNYSYHHKSIATRKANVSKKEDEYTKKMRDLAASNKEYKILYYNKLHDYYVLKQESQMDDSIDLGLKPPPGVTCKDLKGLVNQCRKGNAVIVTDELLADLGVDGKGILTDKAKGKKLVTGVKTLFRHFFGSKKETTNAYLLGKMLVDGDIFGAQASKEVSSVIARTYTRSVFLPWRILKAMDSKCQGSLNDSAIRDYAHIEKEASDVKYKRGASLLPDRNGIGIVRKVLDNIIDPILGVQHNANATKSQHGDHVQVHHEKAIRFLLDGFGLTQKAINEGVELCFTANGATICGAKCASQTAAGVKILDIDTIAIDPDSGERLFVAETDDNNKVLYLKNCQTFKNHALFEILLHSETKEIVCDVFAEFFRFGIEMGDKGLAASEHGPALKPGLTLVPADMSLLHKVTCRGGACKVKKFFCICCEAHSDEDMFSFLTGPGVCSICKENNRTTCRHRPLNDDDEIERKTHELYQILMQDLKRRLGKTTSLKDVIPDHLTDTITSTGEPTLPLAQYLSHISHSEEESEVLKSSKLYYCPEVLNKRGRLNVDVDVSKMSRPENNEFNLNVLHDLTIRGYAESDLLRNYSKEERHSLLCNSLKLGRRIRMIRNALQIEVDASLAGQVVPLDRAIPCILHATNCTVEKFIEQLLLHGMRGFDTKTQRSAFIARVQKTINCDVMGKSAFNELGQWRIPMEKDKLGDIKLSCPDVNKIVDKIDLVVKACTEHLSKSRQEEWLACAMYYSMTMDKLKSRNVFKFEDVCEFQGMADEFRDLYIHLTGVEGMTNYFHFLVAGHFSYYLLRYKNLYKYSQQGWERINGKAKRHYNHNTQRGGGRGGSSKLLPILRMFNCELFWRFKYGDSLFKREEDAVLKYGNILKQYIPSEEEVELLANTILNVGCDEDIFGGDDDWDWNDDGDSCD